MQQEIGIKRKGVLCKHYTLTLVYVIKQCYISVVKKAHKYFPYNAKRSGIVDSKHW
jgi:hypothetical protein